jgi:hypothetical protein
MYFIQPHGCHTNKKCLICNSSKFSGVIPQTPFKREGFGSEEDRGIGGDWRYGRRLNGGKGKRRDRG